VITEQGARVEGATVGLGSSLDEWHRMKRRERVMVMGGVLL